MKLIAISSAEEKLLKVAGEFKTGLDEILDLSDYVYDASMLTTLASKFLLFDEILLISSVNFNFLNSNVVRLFELFNGQNLTLKQTISVCLVADDDRVDLAYIESYLKRVSDTLKFSLVGVDLVLNGVSNKKENKENLNKNQVTIYTDGACSGNPGAGGWGAVLISGSKQKEISGFEMETTNNKMELTAVIKALQELKQPCAVELYSDSAYVVNAIKQGWLENWKKNGWIGSDKKAVKNIDLWKQLDALLIKHSVNFNKVKGHADNELNNRCDALATGEIAKNANV